MNDQLPNNSLIGDLSNLGLKKREKKKITRKKNKGRRKEDAEAKSEISNLYC